MPNRVLLVEDSRAFASLLKNAIQHSYHYEVDVARSLEETQQLLLDNRDKYFVATVDFNLPDAPNGEAIDVVIHHHIPTIVFTSSEDTKLEKGLWQKGISDYACKTGTYNIDYVTWIINRIHSNSNVEVLVVDDSLLERKRIKTLLKTQGCIVHTANSAENAMIALEQNGNIRICIVDFHMEETDGMSLCSQIREKYPRQRLEIIGISATEGGHLPAQFIKSGANDFIKKPFTPEEFLCRINYSAERIENTMELESLNSVKNRFIGMAAHDIRGPLAAIKTASDFLCRRKNDAERTTQLNEMINSSSKGLLALLETLLDVSAIESGNIQLSVEDTCLSELIQERASLYYSEAKAKELDIHVNLENGVMAPVDRVKFKQVIDNLLTNAIKYSGHGGKIKVQLRCEEERIIVSVEDAGPGIPYNEQHLLFNAYTVLSTSTTGGEKKTGLGLAIAKSIMDAHSGEIYYRHDEEIHSTFYLEIPAMICRLNEAGTYN